MVELHPVQGQTGEYKISTLQDVIQICKNVGLKVYVIMSDNDAKNEATIRAAVGVNARQDIPAEFDFPLPDGSTVRMCYLLDSVHNMKNARNNWINKVDALSRYCDSILPERKVMYLCTVSLLTDSFLVLLVTEGRLENSKVR
jgi:hypothetical protein